MIIKEIILNNILSLPFILLALAMVFGSFIHYFNKVLFVSGEKQVNAIENFKTSYGFFNALAISLPLFVLLYLGVYTPHLLMAYLEKLTELLWI